MNLSRTRRYAAPLALVTLICFLSTLLPPRPARADAAAAVAPLPDGAGGAPSLAAPPPTGNTAPSLASVDLPTGAATASYPFRLQTARGEAQPSLRLTYSSSRGVGSAGVGWTLNVPAIVRQGVGGAPRFVDTVLDRQANPSTDYQADEYVADGVRLIPICIVANGACNNAPASERFPSNLNGAAYFRKEIDDGARYFFQVASHDAQRWIVQTKSGHTIQFGAPTDGLLTSGVEYEPTDVALSTRMGPNPAFRWNIVRDADASGNTVYYTYDSLSALLPPGWYTPGLLYLSDIYDTPRVGATLQDSAFEHRVHLTWGLPVPNTQIDLLYDAIWRALPFARLNRVDVTSYGLSTPTQRQLVRSYTLNYLWNPWNTQYYLASVSAYGNCGRNTGTDNPVPEPAAFTATCPVLASTTNYSYAQISGVAAPTPPPIVASAPVPQLSPSWPVGTSRTYQYLDLNGDGALDLLEGPLQPGSGSLALAAALNLDGFNASQSTMTLASSNPAGLQASLNDLSPGGPQLIYGDWLANGQLNWLWLNVDGSLQAHPEVYTPSFSGGAGTSSLIGTSLPGFPTTAGWQRGRSVDVDGDGLTDMTLVPVPNNAAAFTTSLSVRDRRGVTSPFGGATISACTSAAMDPATYGSDTFRTMADMDGDGVPDLTLVNRPTNGGLGTVVLPNRGWGQFGGPVANPPAGCAFGGSGAPLVPTSPGTAVDIGLDRISDQSIMRFSDLNGDHLADLAVLGPHGLHVCLRTGYSIANLGWSCVAQTPQQLGVPGTGLVDLSQSGMAVADLDATGIERVIYFTQSSPAHALSFTLPGSQPLGLLTHVATSNGATTDITYSPAFPHGPPVSAWTVSTMVTRNGLTGSLLDMDSRSFVYAGPMYDGRDRQFVGFQVVDETTAGDAAVPGVTHRTTFATPTCSTGNPYQCAGTQEYGFYRSLRGLPVTFEDFDPVSSAHLKTAWNEYRWQQAYFGLDGRSVIQRTLFRQHSYLWDPSQTITNQSVPFLGSSFPQTTLTVSLPVGAPEIRHETNYDLNLNPTSSVDYGVVGQDQSILTSRAWQLPTGDLTGWSYRLFGTQTGYMNPDRSFAGPVRQYVYNYDANGRLTLQAGVLTGTRALPGPPGQARAAGAPPEASQDGLQTLAVLSYDAYGNVTQVSGANQRCVGATYDSTFSQWPTTTLVFRGGCGNVPLITTHSFDNALEREMSTLSPSAILTTADYDDFGRMLNAYQASSVTAGMSDPFPILKVHYLDNRLAREVHVQLADGVEDELKGTAPGYVDRYQYMDSLGYPIFTVEAAGRSGANKFWQLSGAAIRGHGVVETVFQPTTLIGTQTFPLNPSTLPFNNGTTASLQYDPLGRVLSATDFNGNTTRRTYHATALSVDTQDAEQAPGGLHAGALSTMTVNGHGQVVSIDKRLVHGPQGAGDLVTTRTYQSTGEVTSITQSYPSGSITRWMQYDSLGRMVFNAEPNTSPNFTPVIGGAMSGWSYAYNVSGQLVGTSDARGCGENLFHDNAGRIIAEDYSPCDSAQPGYSGPPNLVNGDNTEAYYFYVNDALTDVYDRGAHTHFVRDPRNRVTSLQRNIANPAESSAIGLRYTAKQFSQNVLQYSAANRVLIESTGATDPRLMASGASQTSTVYNELGQLDSLSSSYGSLVAESDYYPSGTIAHRVFGDLAGTVLDVGQDQIGAITSYHLHRPGTALFDLANVSIQYDHVGNPTSIVDDSEASQWPAGALPASSTYSYFDDYRISKVLTSYGAAGGTDTFASPYTAGELASRKYRPVFASPKRIAMQSFSYDWLGNTTFSSDDSGVVYDRALGPIVNGTATNGPNQMRTALRGTPHSLLNFG